VLFFAGASHELKRLAVMARESWRKSPAADRVVIAGFGSALIALAAFAGYRGLWKTPRMLARVEDARAALGVPKQEAYHWLAEHSDPEGAVISYDDAPLYLFTGRHGMRALSPLTDSFFAQSESLLARDLDGITDTAAALGARYWVTSPDDFDMTHAPDEIRESVAAALAPAPVVFASGDGKVKIYDVSQMPWARASQAALRSGERGGALK
jgi:hypothetical protein